MTAKVLLVTQGPGAVVLGTLLPVFPLLVILAGMASILHGRMLQASAERSEDTGSLGGSMRVLGMFLVVVALPFAPAILVVFGVVGALIAVPWLRVVRRTELIPKATAWRDLPRPLTLYLAGGAMACLLLMLFDPSPWLPREDIDAGDERLSGYVLKESEHELIVLRADSGVVVRVRLTAEEPVTRRYCAEPSEVKSDWWRPVLAIPRESYPACRY